MPQISVTIPDDLHRLLQELSEETGQSISGLVADFIKQGAYTEAEMRKKIAEFRNMRESKQSK
ncbi:ribbon-helix-helix domain-containing protein [Coleofasciculus sp. LEGE 07092]|uniref:ribbon-helix-helix domain-containing protein n=1 Tax=Coleofasciculus sp. LEGE 07092 TaxID=2777969 RepID=UPI0018807465|nr:ribbon-helix-helix protein, CopG family [Coleofasciculus sp. LEGE 07092]MBE9151044.1 ribbon-helix-helix protein, CopG family [Coleofasciculus sp. LEGE 07092]